MEEASIRVEPLEGDATTASAQSWWWYVNVVLRYRRFILATALGCMIAAALFSLRLERQYSASVLFVPQQTTSQGSLGQLAVQFGLPGGAAGGSDTPEFYEALVQSREILRSIVTAEYDVGEPEPFEGDLIEYFEITGETRDQQVREAVGTLSSRITTGVARTTGVIQFTVEMPHPQLALEVANGILELVNDFNLEKRRDQARAEREFVEQRLAEARAAMRGAENALTVFYERNRNFTQGRHPLSPLAAEETRLERELALRNQIYGSLAQSLEEARLKEVRNTPVITVLQRPDGFVEPTPRGTVRNSVLGLLAGGFLAIMMAFVRQYFRESRERGARDFREFEGLWRETLPWRRRSAR